ncbi:MAG: transposase [Candidatus Schekmanbacteria bacterium]|nr:transposase [Candidatus Schekmanbacteria bacterium]
MARPLRIQYSGALYHVTTRGNDKNHIFIDEVDRQIFFSALSVAVKRYNWICHAYCLMDNHYHLLIETPDANLSRGMKHLNGVYTQAFNKLHNRVGHVFQGRYKAVLVDKETHFLAVARYIVLNPVRAGSVKYPGEWKWSSFNATAGYEVPASFLITSFILSHFGENIKTACDEYLEFVKAGLNVESIWGKLRGQILLGSDDFTEKFISQVKDHKAIAEIPGVQRYIGRPTLEKLFDRKTLRDRIERNRRIMEALDNYGYSQKEIADYLHMHYSTISRLINETI